MHPNGSQNQLPNGGGSDHGEGVKHVGSVRRAVQGSSKCGWRFVAEALAQSDHRVGNRDHGDTSDGDNNEEDGNDSGGAQSEEFGLQGGDSSSVSSDDSASVG